MDLKNLCDIHLTLHPRIVHGRCRSLSQEGVEARPVPLGDPMPNVTQVEH